MAINPAKLKTVVAAVIVAVVTLGTNSFADNPVVQTKFTADPAPMVVGDTVYLYHRS